MAFNRPHALVPITFNYIGALDALTDVVLGYIQADFELFYLDWIIYDANDTFDTTLLTLEYDVAAGTDVVIDTIQTGANTISGTVDRDSLTTDKVPANARVLLTVDDVGTGADGGLTITLWGYPKSGW